MTPGPWLVARIEPYEEDPASPPFCQILAGELGGGHSFEVHGIMPEADAYLISAAPNLYRALADLLSIAQDEGIVGDNTTIPAALSALAKARGEQVSA